ncbi:unnamed protein product [Gongylonema pulchrum]|uniref:Nucleolar protein 6 n=1 Tax=Gongylonema pulchrum TaxID=637853 RepID=A0A183D236_9BILA|nr:unnamed protein product [Gongylonema pulchrum]
MKRAAGDGDSEEFEKKRARRRLICMQIDDFIDEIKLPDAQRNKLEELASTVKSLIYVAKEMKKAHQVCDLKNLQSANIQFPVLLPFGLDLSKIESSCDCRWIHPAKIEIAGSWRSGYQTKDEPVMDLIIIMPRNYFGSHDYQNFTYFIKRAHYLAQTAQILIKAGLSVKFGTKQQDPLKPVLIVFNSDALESEGYLRLDFVPQRSFAKISKFRPENNNLLPSFCSTQFDSLDSNIPTPIYNSKIAADLVRKEMEAKFEEFFRENSNFSRAYIMVRSWMYRRGFAQVYLNIDNF